MIDASVNPALNLMELGWTALVLLVLAALLGWFWQDSLAARERANAAAIEACERLSLQFLDGTVAFAALKLVRGASGALTLRRTYVFDYTANSIERRQGFVVLTGQRIDSVGYAHGDDVPLTAVEQVRPTIEMPQLPATAKVLSLEEWRERQRSATHTGHDAKQNGTHAGD